MFDIGFWELALILVVALLVVGPERLPRLARTLGMWMGRMRRFVSTVKADIDRELATEDLKKALAKQAEMPELYDIIEETEQAIKPPADKPAPDSADAPAQEPASLEQTPFSDKPDRAHDANG